MSRRALPVALAAALLLTALAVAAAVGPAAIGLTEVLQALLGAADSGPDAAIAALRLTRAAAAGIVGASLGLSGLLLQTATRNALADPYLLGTSGGATLSAVALLTLAHAAGLGELLGRAEPLLALVGALAAASLAIRLGQARGGGSERVILAGLVITAFAGAMTSLLLARADDAGLRAATQWLMGGVAVADPADLVLPALSLVAVGGAALVAADRLDALRLGLDAARGLGVAARQVERRAVLGAAVLAAVAVALAGIVGFVGLLVPHGARALVGASHRRLLPVVLLGGAAFLIAVDALCRLVVSPAELPIGIPTALAGVPLLLSLLRRPAGAPKSQVAPIASAAYSGAEDRAAVPARPLSLGGGAPPGEETPLACRDLAVTLDGVQVLRAVDLSLPKGALVALVGRNAAGKSTLLRALAGALPGDEAGAAVTGTVFDHGAPRRTSPSAVAPGIGWLPQQVELDGAMTAQELVDLALRLDGVAPNELDVRRRLTLAAVDAEALAGRPLGSLSGGQRQRALLAMALARATPTLLLDEPTAALDRAAAAEVMRWLADLASAEGRLVVASSHDLQAVCAYADVIVVVADGGARGYAPDDPALAAALDEVFGDRLVARRRRPRGQPGASTS